MSRDATVSSRSARPSWAARLFRTIAGRDLKRSKAAVSLSSSNTSAYKLKSMTRQLVVDDRYAFLLLREAARDISESEARPAWKALGECMAIVPQGIVPIYTEAGAVVELEIDAYYLDRHAVTNRQFQRFVDAGGYDALEIWPKEVWPSVMKFTDRSHRPGPRDWEQGKPPAGKADHPVVGVSWYEAVAYASWIGKRLPTALEWQKAGGWPEQLSGGSCLRYPWGNVFEPGRANLWASGKNGTVPVDQYDQGATPNGIYQMVGNVWEWLSDPLTVIPCRTGETFQVWRPTRRIAGALSTPISQPRRPVTS